MVKVTIILMNIIHGLFNMINYWIIALGIRVLSDSYLVLIVSLTPEYMMTAPTKVVKASWADRMP